jgi:hypothetical protein
VVGIELDVDLPDERFSLEIPEGYQQAVYGEFPEALAVMDARTRSDETQYQYARQRIDRYRAIIWVTSSNPDGDLYGYPQAAAVRDGSRWRTDEFFRQHQESDWPWDPVSRAARSAVGEVGSVAGVQPTQDDFESLWDHLFAVETNRQTMMPIGLKVGRCTRLTRRDGQEAISSGWLSDFRQMHYRLSDLGWPAWPGDESYHPMGPKTVYEQLAASPDRPGQIGLRALTRSSVGAELWVLWMDPARDYLCVRHEHHIRQGRPWADDLDWQPDEPQADEGEKMPRWMREYDQVVEIIDAGQTPEGHWYPRTLRMTFTGLRGGKRFESGDRTLHVYLDTAGSIRDSLFDWPAGMPVPE